MQPTTAAYSRGWAADVRLGAGQERVRQRLAGAIRHPSRTWHEAPTFRSYGTSSGTAHRIVHRLAALGVIAIQTALGAHGGVRYTFAVRMWRTYPPRVGMARRIGVGRVAPAQLEAFAPEAPPPATREAVWNADRYAWELR